MSAQPKPFSPETLAERWGCSAEKVRGMYRSGELPGFRLGKLIRIPANEVERYECKITPSLDTVESGPSPIETQTERADASRLARLTNERPNRSGVRFGNASPPREANG